MTAKTGNVSFWSTRVWCPPPCDWYLLLLLLRSPVISQGSPFWVRFWRMWPFFFNPTIEVVTFPLRGWCMLGVFLFPAFTRPGHECQDLWSPCDGMHVCTDSHPKEFLGNGVRTHVNSKGKITSTGKILLRGDWYHRPWPSKRFFRPVVEASATRATDRGFDSSFRQGSFSMVESYKWLKHWHSTGYPDRRLAL